MIACVPAISLFTRRSLASISTSRVYDTSKVENRERRSRIDTEVVVVVQELENAGRLLAGGKSSALQTMQTCCRNYKLFLIHNLVHLRLPIISSLVLGMNPRQGYGSFTRAIQSMHVNFEKHLSSLGSP